MIIQAALADEWLAYYQYLKGALVLSTLRIPKDKVWFQAIKELREHAQDERRHAHWLMNIIVSSGSVPELNPAAWARIANCRYIKPVRDFETIIRQNMTGETCAIEAYQELLEQDSSLHTMMILKKIKEEEEEHLKDLNEILLDWSAKHG